jgi:hypothetical protein
MLLVLGLWTLLRYLAYYNEQRAPSGYRLRGRTPADLFWGAVTRRS